MKHPFESELSAHYRHPEFRSGPGYTESHLQSGATGASMGWADSMGRAELVPFGEPDEIDQDVFDTPEVIASSYTVRSYRGRGPLNAGRSDERVREMICDRLVDDDYVDPSDVSIEVREGEVTLEGTVAQRYMKHRIEDLADSFKEVKEIHNHLRVLPRTGMANSVG